MSTGIIYCAHCLVTGKKYIGQTRQGFEKRIKNHKNHSKHFDLLFYRAINKHGWDNFVWGIVEECDLEILNEREIYWIQHYDTYKSGYNMSVGGNYKITPSVFKEYEIESPEGEIFTGKNVCQFCRDHNLHSAPIFRILNGKRESHKGWKLPNTEITYDKKTTKKFCLTSPNGEIINGRNISKFCKENDLDYISLRKVLSGERKSHKGWRLPETKLIGAESAAEALSKEFVLLSPEGQIINEKNINKFCRKYGLKSKGIIEVINGKQKSHKGWRLPETKLIGKEATAESLSKKFTLLSPEDKLITSKNINKFCRENNLIPTNLADVINGKRKSHKGWRLPETKLIGGQSAAELQAKEFLLLSPEGKIVEGKNITKFCKENGLTSSAICAVMNGRKKSHKGWTKYKGVF